MSLSLVASDGVVRIVLGSPLLSTGLLEALGAALERLSSAPLPSPLVVASSHPRIFLAGAHLAEIGTLDGDSSKAYAARGRAVLGRLAAHPAPVLAAVAGACAGGGLDLVLACDAVVASADASFSHPGVRRGLVTGWGGTVSLPAALGRPAASRALLEGEPVPLERLVACGVVRRIAADPVAAAAQEGRRLARLHPSRLAILRAARRGRLVDSFRASVVHRICCNDSVSPQTGETVKRGGDLVERVERR